MTTNICGSTLGSCPFCGTSIDEIDVLITYQTDNGETAAFAECPGCEDVVTPEA